LFGAGIKRRKGERRKRRRDRRQQRAKRIEGERQREIGFFVVEFA